MESDIYQGIVVPASALRREQRRNRYGEVPDLEGEEPADPDELERQVFLDMWGPVLALPVHGRSGFQPQYEDGVRVDAFATVDFERTMPERDRFGSKIGALNEELRNTVILVDIVTRRLPKARYQVLKYLRMGVIDFDHIVNDDMRELARLHARANRLRDEIQGLRAARERRAERALATLVG